MCLGGGGGVAQLVCVQSDYSTAPAQLILDCKSFSVTLHQLAKGTYINMACKKHTALWQLHI